MREDDYVGSSNTVVGYNQERERGWLQLEDLQGQKTGRCTE